jgi:CheY-like chemotaxis protein
MNAPSVILAVDRNPRNLELLSQFLGNEGFTTRRAATIEEFDAALDESAPVGLALVDIAGFDRSIWERCERLRDRDIPLLVLSPRHSAALQQESLAHGARGVLVKPLAMRELLGLIRSLLDEPPEPVAAGFQPAVAGGFQPPGANEAGRTPALPAGSRSLRQAGKPAATEAAGKPAATEAAGKPAATEAAGKPAATEAAGKPAATEAAGKPAATEAAAKPAATEAAGTHVAGFHFRGRLPHIKREGAVYFVTFRLADSLPATEVVQLKHEREAILAHALAHKRPLTWHEEQQLLAWYSEKVERLLDAGHGACWLRRPDVADLVAGAVKFFAGQRYDLRAWVVMPNHVHAVVWPRPGHTLGRILHSWKSYTANEANRPLARPGQPFWQKESYDDWTREDAERARLVAYVEDNPVKAGLCARPEDWRWSSAHDRAVAAGILPAVGGGFQPPNPPHIAWP